jgi:hypothetical protein
VTRKSRPRPLGGFQEFTDRKVGPGLKKFSQVPGECGRPQSQNIVVPAPGSRNGNHVRGDCCFTQPLYQIGRKERDVPSKGRQAIGPKRCGPFHPGKDAGQGPGEVGYRIGNHRQFEFLGLVGSGAGANCQWET